MCNQLHRRCRTDQFDGGKLPAPVPELPEVETLTNFIADQARGKTVQRCELAAFSALKTFDPPLDALMGKTVISSRRLGKYICLAFDELWMVIHLARGGWIRWYESVPSG